MQHYCGIDHHRNNSLVSLIIDNDQLICDKRQDNDLETIERIKGDLAVIYSLRPLSLLQFSVIKI